MKTIGLIVIAALVVVAYTSLWFIGGFLIGAAYELLRIFG